MALEKAKLHNGLTIYVDHMPSNLDNTVAMFIPFGSVNEALGQEGVAHVVEHCVHLRTDEFENQQVLDQHAELNGMLADAGTTYSSTQYQADGLGIEPNLHYLSQILQHPHFPGEMVNDEIGVIRQEAKAHLDDPGALHNLSAVSANFGKPYGRAIIGYHDKIDFEANELKRIHEQHYKLGSMTLVVAGAATLDEVALLAEKHFVADGVNSNTQSEPVPAYGMQHRTGYVLEDANSVQMKISHPMTADFRERYQNDSLPYAVAMHAIGRAAFRLLRQERGLVYYGGVSFSTDNHPNAWGISGDAEIDAEHIASAEEAFEEVLTRDSSGYESDEIKGSLAMYRYGLLKEASMADGRLAMHLDRLGSHKEPLDVSTIQHRFSDITEADVRARIDDIVDQIYLTPRYTHLTGTREDIGEVDRVIQRSEFI